MITNEEIESLIEIQRTKRSVISNLKLFTTNEDDVFRYETVIRFIDGFINELEYVLTGGTFNP